MKVNDRLRYVHEHIACINYNHEDSDPLVEIHKPGKGEVYKHLMREPTIVLLLEGRLVLSSDGEKFDIDREQLVLLLPNQQVILSAQEDSFMLFCKLATEIKYCECFKLEDLTPYAPADVKKYYPMPMLPVVRMYMEPFVYCLEQKLRCKHFLRMKIEELMLLFRAFYAKEEIAAFFFPLLGDDYMFRDFINKNILHCKSVHELAGKANMSENGFRKKFKKVMNCSPAEFMEGQKAEKIEYELVCTTTPIKEICDRYGFSTLAGFSSFCKKNLQDTPAKIRKQRIRF